MKPARILCTLLVLALMVSCGGQEAGSVAITGRWRGVLESPGGELPFELLLHTREDGNLSAVVLNGAERVTPDRTEREGDHVRLSFDHFDSVIEATLSSDGSHLGGIWSRQSGRERENMTFHASRGETPRFSPLTDAGKTVGLTDLSGDWEVQFTDELGVSPARGEFRQEGTLVEGTFLTPEGDYRYLAGSYEKGVLRLSCFDGGHAFLFQAYALDDGTLAGDFWSRSSYHATWSARRTQADTRVIPDAYGLTKITNSSGRFRFSFSDLDGEIISDQDPRFAGKVVLIDIFGSWCPNCNDEAPVLVDLYRRYHDRGLEIVGLAFEMTGNRDRDLVFVRKYADRYDVPYPLLLAGTQDKTEASRTLPDLSGISSFPTLIFVDRRGVVQAIHTGFAGPGTGHHFTELKKDYVKRIEDLL